MNRLPFAALAFCLVLTFFSSVFAHELRPAVADASTLTDQGVRISLRINLEAIVAGIGPEHDNTDQAEQRDLYNELRALPATDLQQRFEIMQSDFLDMISTQNDEGMAVSAALESLAIPDTGDIRLPRDTLMTLILNDDKLSEGLSWQWNEQLGPLIIRTASDDVQGFSQYLQPGQRSDTFSLLEDNQQSAISKFIDYIVIGVEHIVPKGLDHILFVIGLFLLAPAFKPVLWQVSAFTLAHTVTLGLGISGIVNVPPSVVEPLIALSITLICAENLFKNDIGRLRIALVFVFGLLHGLGFAGVLGEIGLPAGQFFQSLLAFNIGVEIGQLLVLFTCFATVGWWFGKKAWYRTVVTVPASIIIGLIGLFWFLQRIGLIR